MISTSIQFDNYEIPLRKVLARLGYAEGKTLLTDDLTSDIEQEIALAKKLITPKQVIANSKISVRTSNTVYLEPSLTINSKNIANLLHDSSDAYGFAVTIGPNLEKKVKDYMSSKETAKATILDAIGSVTAEELAELTNKQLRSELKDKSLTHRFSPGYGDWDIKSHAEFLKWLGAEKIGIVLNEAFHMAPEKSVSAILGVKIIE